MDGILPGGGAAYIHASRRLQDGASESSPIANRILRAALTAPATRIAENAGFDGRGISARLLENRNPATGFDAEAGDFRDLLAAGVVDPARVAVAALQAANSVAALFLTAETVVAKPPPPPRPTSSEDIPFGPEAKDMTAEEAGGFGLV